jgi:hypothetical protein
VDQNSNNMYSLKDSPFHGSPFNHFYWYAEHFKVQPNLYECKIPIKYSILEKIESGGGEQIFIHKVDVKKKQKHLEENEEESVEEYSNTAEINFLYKDCLIIINWTTSHHFSLEYDPDQNFSKYYAKILYQKEETVNDIKEKFEYHIEKNKKNVNLLCRIEGELTTQKFEIKLPQEEIDLELNYGKEIVEKTELLKKALKKNTSGLALFSGPPGTGKSTYIKYLSTITNRRIIYLPSASIDEITSPDFLTFMIDCKNSILLLEDAEKVLISRELKENPGISNILNMTDGLLGDCLSVFIIATFNTTRDKIDQALLRKGRLVLEHEFDKLTVENCNKILEIIKSDRKTDVPLSLADIYVSEENYHAKKEQKRKVGF